MTGNHSTNKGTVAGGNTLSASDWNALATDVNELVAGGGAGTGNVTIGDASNNSHMYINSKGNLCIETTVDNVPSGKKGKINIESKDDLQLKPGDDIIFYSSHRPAASRDEVAVKVTDDADNPVKLQLNMADIVLTTKDKGSTLAKDANGDDISGTLLYDDPNVLNVTVNSAKNTRGYLKVRAKAIDLRCEDNGGIALQPKGNDSDNRENKIKFEHNGGDGKEFGTFNTEKTSIFTNEYRFNKDGIVYAVARGALETTYKTPGDPSSGVKKIDYPTQDDDFKDIPITEDGQLCEWNEGDNEWQPPHDYGVGNMLACTWEDIVKAVCYMKWNHQGPWASQS